MRQVRQVGDVSVEAGREPTQLGWYRRASEVVRGHSVLDVGCGLGVGLGILKQTSAQAHGQDLDPRLARPDVTIDLVTNFTPQSYDFIVCIDVIEHVDNDGEFLAALTRIARRGVFLTTPLSIYGRPPWPYHPREYRFGEFVKLTSRFGRCDYFKGDPTGAEAYAITYPGVFASFHRLLNSPWTNMPTRAAQKLLPRALRNHAHQAALVHISPS
jgi:SAM-dependent methyltransferase